MAENQPENKAAQEISTIRDILMGQHIAQYAAKFQSLDETIAANETDFNERLQAMKENVDNHFDELEQHVKERFDQLESLLLENVSKLNDRINKASTDDKLTLAEMLSEVSKKLVGE